LRQIFAQVKNTGPSARQIRILVADDFSQWRSVVRTILQNRPEWRIVCEANNGEDAVQKTAEYEPDIALLDIGMPILNGFEAAARIQRSSPSCKIIFLTQNNDLEIAQNAMRMGVAAYVLKANAYCDLPVAISAALDRTVFVSATLTFEPV
jgi:DNA-binding NarL/FixJ family response regulator